MSQPSLKEKLKDEQLLSTAFAVKLEDAKTDLSSAQIRKTQNHTQWTIQLKHRVLYQKYFHKMDSIDSRLQKLETGEQHRDWNLYKVVWKLENFSVIFSNAKLFEETKTKMIPTQIGKRT